MLIRGQIEDKVLQEFERSQLEFEKMYPDFNNPDAKEMDKVDDEGCW